nr:PREDICTED: nuclear valosin-containing protein-like [Lepisosteus oculatus]
MKNRGGYFVDNRLKQRVKEYLSSRGSPYVDLAAAAAELQRMYSTEYGRRKRNAFRIQIEKVYAAICNETDITALENEHLAKRARHSQQADGEDKSFTDDTTDTEDDQLEHPPANHMNSSLLSLYRKGTPERGTPVSRELAGDSPAPALQELELPLLKVSAPELVSGVSGESEQKLRDLFDQAVSSAPCILFIDEIDAITPKREVASKDMERRIVAQLLTCMDDLGSLSVPAQVLVIGATNRPDSLDPALRRAGRFDKEICLGIPDEGARLRILQTLCRKLRLPEAFDLQALAHLTPGYVGADLMALCREAAMTAINRILIEMQDGDKPTQEAEGQGQADGSCTEGASVQPQHKDMSAEAELCRLLALLKSDSVLSEEQLGQLTIEMDDFRASLSSVQPSAKREGFATVPDVTWADIGALQDVREELTMAILAPVRNPEQFRALGLSAPAGVLLAGPPGCGKTLLAKAVANESGLNFISVKGPELLNMYVGESERAVRQVFQRGRNSAPCVIFFDEIDALCPRRSDHESGASVRVVNQLLTEMDGLEARKQVFIMAATNRPDIIDPAVLRPGRLDKTLYVGLPPAADRLAILQTITKGGKRPLLEEDVSLEEIASDERCDCFTGADLSALVREASINALRVHLPPRPSAAAPVVDIRVSRQNFQDALKKVKPSVSKKDQRMYELLKESLSR